MKSNTLVKFIGISQRALSRASRHLQDHCQNGSYESDLSSVPARPRRDLNDSTPSIDHVSSKHMETVSKNSAVLPKCGNHAVNIVFYYLFSYRLNIKTGSTDRHSSEDRRLVARVEPEGPERREGQQVLVRERGERRVEGRAFRVVEVDAVAGPVEPGLPLREPHGQHRLEAVRGLPQRQKVLRAPRRGVVAVVDQGRAAPQEVADVLAAGLGHVHEVPR